MRDLKQLELGLIFWGTADPEHDIRSVRSFGLEAGQLGIGGELSLHGLAQRWQTALKENPDFHLSTAVCSYVGEDYTDIAAVQETVGLVPEATRAERVLRTKHVAAVAADLGIRAVACHIGFVPEDRHSAAYRKLEDLVREICDRLVKDHQEFTLETGQESAEALRIFIEDVGRSNLKINFDPANMILYGTGDPVAALHVLAQKVTSVHCKDGAAPSGPGRLGLEQPLGKGEVNFPQFLQTLQAVGYRGILSIEREEPNAEQRSADIHHAVSFLRSLLPSTNA